MKLRLAHLYPRLMNIYGDRGNIICLHRRCEARGIELALSELEAGDAFQPDDHDMVFIGGAQDREQRRVADDLLGAKADAIREAVERDVVVLAVCGGYQLFGRYYRESIPATRARRRSASSETSSLSGKGRRWSVSKITAGARISAKVRGQWHGS
jgi:CobQ-like glutamine amidotransferase family enzyme